jgi:hypothetical protein
MVFADHLVVNPPATGAAMSIKRSLRIGLMAVALGIMGMSQARAGETVTVDPATAAIVLPDKASATQKEAGVELAHHLKLITQTDIPTRPAGAADASKGFTFYIGTPPAGTQKPLADEEARWTVTPTAVYLRGEGTNGDLFAVYSFLQQQLGVHWVEPGDDGIAFTPSKTLALTAGEFNWVPKLQMRKIRVYARPGQYPVLKDYVKEYAEFLPTHAQNDQRAQEVRQWQLRMRMGSHSSINYGHAFTGWWDKYSKTHPEYFALNKWGQRAPELRVKPTTAAPTYTAKDKASVKLCVSNPAVADQIVENWLKSGRRSHSVDVCMNDQVWGFCQCDKCRALDVTLPGEKWEDHLTDRYVYLANEVARRIRKYDPKATAVMYSYETTLQPPRKIRVEPNVVVAIVPVSVEGANVRKLFEGWKAMGATMLLTRPNYPTYYKTLGLPMGFEKQMVDAFQVAWKNGAVGADYDSLMGLWPYTGLSDYTLARTFAEPSRPLADFEAEYYSAYGPASEEIKNYFRYWREQFWEKRIVPHLEQIVAEGKYHNFARGLIWSLGDYYHDGDFDATDAMLTAAAKKDLSPQQRHRVEELQIANRNARLTVDAVAAKGMDKFQHSLALMNFRKKHIHDSDFAWFTMFATETRYGDLTGTKTAIQLSSYPLPWVQTGVAWRFKLDPQDQGWKEKWQELPWSKTADWDQLRTDFYWDNPYRSETAPALLAKLKGYDGIGWYSTQVRIPPEFKGRTILLHFGAVDDSCWVYVNGKPAGKHLYEKSSDVYSPFEIDITNEVDPSSPEQTVTVRVEDKAGAGGIWKRVWLVSKLK